MGFFSKFRKWMGAEEPTERKEPSAAPVEDRKETAGDAGAQPPADHAVVTEAPDAMPAPVATSETSPESAPTGETPDAVAAPVSEPAADVAPEEAAASSVPEPAAAEPAVPELPVSEPAAAEAAPESLVTEAPDAMPASAAVSEASPEAAPTAETPDAVAAPVSEPAADVAPEEDAASAASSAPEPVAAEPAVPEPSVSEPAAEPAPEPLVTEAPDAMPASVAVSEDSPEAAPTAETPDAVAAPVSEPAADVAPEEDAASAASSAPEPVAAEPVVSEPPVSEPAAEAAPEPVVAEAPQAAAASPAREPRKKKGWFASLFGGNDDEEREEQPATPAVSAAPVDDAAMTLRLREAEPRLSVWLSIVLEGVDEAGDELWRRLRFLLRSLDAPAEEVDVFVDEFARWLERMEYHHLDEFRSELQYRLALALDMEDEEDERNRLFLKISDGLARTREQFSRQLNAVFSGHGELTEQFWEELEELFIMADLGYEASIALVERLRKRAAENGVVRTEGMRAVLRDEIEEIFRVPRKITAFNPPEVILFIGVNGVGKTTTIAKLAYRARMQGKKVMIAAADTFRAAAIEQLQVWADRVGALFHARPAGSDPASVAFEAMDRALAEQVDILFVDTAGRLQTKHNLMEELTKIRAVLGKKHPGAPHRTILALDATTGQNALSQAKLFKEAAGVDELILTKLDGTAKGGVAIAVAMQEHLPISYIGLGEKLEDLRPFNGDDYARALLGEGDIVGTGK